MGNNRNNSVTLFCVVGREGTRIFQQNCFFHEIINGLDPLPGSELDTFDQEYVEFSHNPRNPRSELFNCGSLHQNISLRIQIPPCQSSGVGKRESQGEHKPLTVFL